MRAQNPRFPMRLFSSIALAAGLVVALAACDAAAPEAVTAEAAREEVAVCHYSPDTDTYELLSVGAPGAAAHDAQHDRDYVGADYEGAPVPDVDGFVFDAACQPVSACPCFDVADLEAQGPVAGYADPFPGIDDLGYILFQNGAGACSGFLCFSNTGRTCLLSTGDGLITSEVTEVEDAACRVNLAAVGGGAAASALVTRDGSSLVPFLSR